MKDDPIRAALDAAEDALLSHLWVHDGGLGRSELTPERIATIRGYGEASGWNAKTRGAAAAIVAFLRRAADVHAGCYSGMEPREALKWLAAAVERAAREAGDA